MFSEEREDLTDLHRWQNNEEIMRLARSFPDHVISKEALEAEFARELKGEDTGRRAYIIVEKFSRKPVGWATIRIHQFQRRMTAADVGVALGRGRRGTRVTGQRPLDYSWMRCLDN